MKELERRKVEFLLTFLFIGAVSFICSYGISRNLLVSILIGLVLPFLNGLVLFLREKLADA